MPVAEVVTLPVVNEGAITVLEDALALARSGVIDAVAIAYVRPDGAVNSCYSDSRNAVTLLGALDILGARMRRRMLADEEIP